MIWTARFCCQTIPSSCRKTAIAAARARGVNVVLTTGRPYAGVHSYLKELHMEQPGDYCITYNGALVQKASDGSTVAQTALSYDDYRYLEQLSRDVGSHFHALTAIRSIPLTAM
nr:phosphatase YidA [Raoultella sp. NCTC 9187]